MIDPTRTAVAIVCVPCRQRDGFFVPVAETVLASLNGPEQSHPAIGLAALLRHPDTAEALRRRGVDTVLVAVDDLAVARSWMLPEDAAPVEDLWEQLHRSLIQHFASIKGVSVDVVRFSETLGSTDEFESEVHSAADRLVASLHGPPSPSKTAMETELRRRRRFAETADRRDSENELRLKAAKQLANYAVQGLLMRRWGISAYLPWTSDEVSAMSLREPEFAQLPIQHYYGSFSPEVASAEAAVPDRFGDLREELSLYIADLPGTPGAVRPGFVRPAVQALAKLLMPGARESGMRAVRALNAVVDGGPLNKSRVAHLLGQAAIMPFEPGWEAEQVVKKLFCQLMSRYTDQENDDQYRVHTRIVGDLAASMEGSAEVALGLTGSLAHAPGGMWHPYFSDIDVMPLFSTLPADPLVSEVRDSYALVDRPRCVYLNEGARQGVAGLTEDPARCLFVADRLHRLTSGELAKLGRLVGRMRHCGGSARVYATFSRACQDVLGRSDREDPYGR